MDGVHFSALEERVLLAAQPVVSVSGDASPLVGEQAQFTVTFDNVPDGSAGSDVGYAPYVDLILPRNGADGAGVGSTPPDENDGVTFVSATYLGQAVQATVLEFDASGQAVHPFAKDASGQLRVVNAADYGAAAGDELVVLQLPFGSVVPDQPAADIQVTVQVSELADVGVPLPISAVGGFAFGRDASDNPTADVPVLGTPVTASVTPTLLEFDKVYNGPEGETATGPSFPRSYTVSLDLATGQTISNAIFLDTLPDGVVVVGTPVLAGFAGTAAYDPLTHTVTATVPGPVTGVAGVDATLTIQFYVGEFMAPGDPTTPVLDPATGAPRTLDNNVSASLDWTPTDTRDTPETIVIDEPGPEASFVARSIATQKSQAVVVDSNAPGLGPGDTIEYTIDVQISDYYEFQDLLVRDQLGDGQAYVDGSARLEVVEAGLTAGSGAFTLPHILVLRSGVTGQTALSFNVSDQMLANGAPDGLLTGGESGGGPTTLRIVYRVTVESTFLGNGNPVDEGDSFTNDVQVQGEVVDGGLPTGNTPGDTSASSGTIATGSATKDIYAINGTIIAPGSAVAVGAGDLVTFRLRYSLPQTLFEQLILTDFLPLPIFDVTLIDAVSLVDEVSAAVPGENTVKWGPDAAAFRAFVTQLPTLSADAAANSATITFSNLSVSAPSPTVVDILFTVRVIDAPFGDGLLLTNQMQTEETNAAGDVVAQDVAIKQFTLTEPELRITKGIVATDNPAGIFTPGAVGPVPFSAPGSSGVRFTGTIDSTALAASPVDSNLQGVDAGDLVTFAIIVENRGSGINGAFDILLDDHHPNGYVIPAGGLNIQVTDGAGNFLPYLFTPTANGGALQLIDPPPRGSVGSLAAYSPTGGANIVVITYDLIVAQSVEANQVISNLAEIENYAAVEGGVDRVPTTTGQVSDTAAIIVLDPDFGKDIVATSLLETGSSAGDPAFPDLNVGETVTFELVATLHEGRIRGLVITDRLPIGAGQLDYVSSQIVSIGANIVEADADGLPTVPLGSPIISVVGNVITFTFASDMVNLADNVVSDADRIVLRVTAVAADVAGNVPGVDLVNTGELAFTANGQTATITDTATAEMVGPAYAVTKTANVEIVQADDLATYTVTVSPLASNALGPAFDATLTDPLLPGFLILEPGTLTLVSGPAGTTISEAGGVVTVTAPVLMPGESVVVTYQARVAPTVLAGAVLPNTVTTTADSYPGTNPLGVERSYTNSATETVRVPGPGVIKTVIDADTSLPETGSALYDSSRPDLAIGEEVTYRIVVTLPEAITQTTTFEDFLPIPGITNEGLFEFISASIVRIGANISGLSPGAAVIGDRNGDLINDFVSLQAGSLFNQADGVIDQDDEIEFSVTARVRDAAVNRAGAAPVNTAVVTFDAGGTISTVTSSVQVDIVEPQLILDKAADFTSGDGGDRITYTVAMSVPRFQDGPAYDVVMTDNVPVGMEIDLATLAFQGGTPAGGTLSYDPGTRLITAFLPVMLFGDPAVTITYQVVVANTVRPDQALTNTASVVFDSHPGSTPDEYERSYGPVEDSETFTVTRPVVVKSISGTDIDATRAAYLSPVIVDVVIGESITYLISVSLPEVTTDLRLTDLLPVFQTEAGDMEWISSRIISVGSNLVFAPGAPQPGDQGIVTDRSGDGRPDTVLWDFGLVANLADNIVSQADLIIVEVVGRVLNLPSNQPADRLVNTAQLEYSRADNSTGTLVDTETVEIVGPELIVDKAASVSTGDAGDIVTYTITVSHDELDSSADAYELVITDALASGLELVVGSVTTSLSNSLGTVTIRSGNTAGDVGIEVALSQLSSAILLADGVLTITYQARLLDTVRDGDVLTNTAALVWQSAPAGFPEARPDSNSDDADVTVVLAGSIDKAVVETSLPETGAGFFDPALPDLAIGETATYEIRVTLGEGTQQVLVQDTLPAGLVFVSGSVVAIGANIGNTAIGVGAAPSVAGGLLVFDFGDDVVNSGDNLADDGDVIVLRVTARVDTSVVAGAVLTNNASFTTDNAVLTDTAPVEVVEPSITITKTPSVMTGDAGDLVAFTVVISQAAGASGPLYDLAMQDILPAGYVLVAGSASATRGTVTETGGTTIGLTLDGLALLSVDDPLTVGTDESRIVLTYSARLADSVQPGEVVTNTVRYSGVSAPGGGVTTKSYSGQDDAEVTVLMPVTLDKTIIATSLPETGSGAFNPGSTDLAQGETVTYRLVATLSEGTQTLVIQDLLPTQLELISAAVTAVGAGLPPGLAAIANSGTGQQVLFDFGTVVNAGNNDIGDGTVTIEVVARVRDTAPFTPGTSLTNAAQVTIASPTAPGAPDGTETATASTTAEIVAPALSIVKVNDVPVGTLVDAGDIVTYTLTVTNSAAATSPAYDIVVTDPLLAVLQLVTGSVATTAGSVTSGNNPGDTSLAVAIPLLRPGESATITFQARLADAVAPNTTLTNTAQADFDSAGGPGGLAGEATDSSDIATALPTIIKAVTATSLAQTGDDQFTAGIPDLAIGETVTYTITVTLPEGTMPVLVADMLPSGVSGAGTIAWESSAITSIGSGISGGAGLVVGAQGVVSDSDGDGVDDLVLWDLGSLVNTGDNLLGDTIVFTVTGRVVDRTENAAGDLLTNTATLDFDGAGATPVLTATAQTETVEPELGPPVKSASIAVGDAGDLVTYSVTIPRSAGATATAFDVVIEDALPTGVVLVPGSLTLNLDPARYVVESGAAPGDTVLRVRVLEYRLDDPASLILTYDARIADGVRDDDIVTNTVGFVYDSAPGDTPGERGYGEQTADASVGVDFVVALDKDIIATSLPETGTTQFDPALNDVAVGETVTYRLVATLGEGTQSLVVQDLLPIGLEGLSATVTFVGSSISGNLLGAGAVGAIAAGGTVTFDFGAAVTNAGDNVLDAGDTIVIEVVARVRDIASNTAGTQLTNDASALSDTGTGTTLAPPQTVEVVAPDLVITKSVDHLTGDAGDIFTYTVIVGHAAGSSSAAYDLVLDDVLDPVFAPLTVTSSLGTATVVGNAVRVVLDTYLLTDGPITITYTAAFRDTVEPGQIVGNTAALAWDSAAGPGGRADDAQASAADLTAVFSLDLSKAIVATSLPETGSGQFDPTLPDLAIGETVTYRLIATLAEGTQTLVIADTLPDGLEVVSAAVTDVGTGLPVALLGITNTGTGQGILFDFGTVVNTGNNILGDGTVTIEVVARARDVPGNTAGAVLTNAATSTITSPADPTAPGGTLTDSAAASAEVVTTELAIIKSVDVTTGDAGDTFTYTVTLSHAAGSVAAAYDVVVLDDLDPVFAPISATSSAGTAVISGNTIRLALPTFLATDAPVVVTYVVAFRDTVQPGQVVGNTATLDYDSSAGPGGRPGQAQASAADITGVFALDLAKSITATSLSGTGTAQFDPVATDLAVGETVTYQLVATLAEGTQTLVIADTLPDGLGLVSAEVTAIGAGLPAALLGIANTGSGQGVLFDFGTVVNTGNNVLGDGTVTITVVARVLDVAGNIAGRVLTNAATAEVTAPDDPARPGGTLTDDAATSAEIVAPDVVITKSSTLASGDAGDEVTFTLVISQQPGASAPLYDLVVTDPIPAGLAIIAGSVTTSRGVVAAGNAAGDTTLRIEVAGEALASADDPLTGDDESIVVITYRARLTDTVQPGQMIVNTGSFAGFSAPVAGAGGEARSFTGQDDTTLVVLMPVALDKQVVATSLVESGAGQLDPGIIDLAIGETVTYRLTATLSEGTQTLVINDTLPDGLEVLSATLFGLGAGVTAGTPNVTITGQSVSFDFGIVTNTGNNDLTDGTVTVEILARVRDVPGNVIGTQLTNAGEVTIASPGDPGAPGGTEQAADNVTVEVVEPKLITDKAAPPGFVGPGETISYAVTLTHAANSTAAAYDLVLEDLLADPYLDLVAGSVTTSLGTVAVGNTAGDTTMRIEVPVLALGQVLTVTFTARVTADAPGGVTLTNTVTDTFDSNAGPGGRPDGGSDSTETPGAPSLAKQIVATSNPDTGTEQFDATLPDLAIGETLTYRLSITLPQGTTDNLVLSDLLPAALQPLAARVVSVGAGLTAGAPTITILGQAISFTFGTVANGSDATVGTEDVIIIEVDALVLDDATISAGDPLVNDAQATFTIGGRDGSLAVTAPAELVEPVLGIAKRVDVTTGDAGDLFTYTVTIDHAASSTAPAYDILVTDTLDARLVPVDVATSFGTASIVGNQIRLEVPRLLTGDAPMTLTYRVRFADSIEPGQIVGNTAALAWDSAAGPGGRADATQASAADLAAVFSLDLSKSIVATSLPETGSGAFDPTLPDLAIGETVTYRLIATLAEGTQTLVIADTLPDGLEVVSAAVTDVGAGLPVALLGITNTGTGQDILFDFGTVVNTGNNILGDGTVTIEVVARVRDVPGNIAGAVLANAATSTITSPTDPTAPGGVLTDSAATSAEVVEPGLANTKSVDHLTGDAGDIFTYTVTVTPTDDTTGPAYNVVVEDALSAYLAAVPGSVTSSAGTAAILGNVIRIEIPVLLPDAPPIIITYRAAFTDAIEPGQLIGNTATLDYTTAPTLGRDFSGAASAEIRGEFALSLTKEIVATSLPETGSGYFDPALPDIAAGETVTYHLTARIAEGTQRLVIAESLPPGLIAETARLVGLGAGIAAAAPVITLEAGRVVFDFGTVVSTGDNIGDDEVVVEIVARLSPTPPPGTVLTNNAVAEVAAPTDPGAAGGRLFAADTAAAEAVAAVLAFDKQAAPGVVGLSEAITYTLILSHAASSTAPAYEVVLQDPLSDASLQLIAGTVVTSAGTIELGNQPGDTGIRVSLPLLMPGQVLVVTFQARAIGVPIPDGIAPNTAVFASTSAPAPVPPGFTRPESGADTAEIQIISGSPPPGDEQLLASFDEAFRRIANNTLNPMTILAGTAEPGAMVTLGLRDRGGAPINVVGVIAGVGGHWVAHVPAPPPQPDWSAWTSLLTLAGRETEPAGFSGLPHHATAPGAAPPYNPLATVSAAEGAAAFDIRAGMEPVRLTFSGVVIPNTAFLGSAASASNVVSAMVGAGVEIDQARLTAPGSIAWNRFALDFVAAAAAAGLTPR